MTMNHLDGLQWACAAIGALMVGVSKAGLTGVSILSVALFAYVFPSSKHASGLVLPLLIFGDCVAVLSYRAHAQWNFVWRLFPWTALGVVLGYFTLGAISDRATRVLVGCIVLALAILSHVRRSRGGAPAAAEGAPVHWGVAIGTGTLAGFVTLIANAAAPLMAIYLIAMRLPKMQYVGTAAIFFLLLNLFKVPFMVHLGLIDLGSFAVNLALLPAVLLGTYCGRLMLLRIDQRLFEQLVLALCALGGVALLL